MCHHFCTDSRRPSTVSAQRALSARSRPAWSTIIFSSIITSASEIANRPISAGTSGTPS